MSKIMRNLLCFIVHFVLLTSVACAEQPKWSQVFWKKDIPSLECPIEIYNSGPFVFANGCYPRTLSVFRKDAKTGLLTYVKDLNYGPDGDAMSPQAAGQHLFMYAASKSDGIIYLAPTCFHMGGVSFGLHWYRINSTTCEITKLGKMKCGYGTLLMSKDEKTLYQCSNFPTRAISWYTLAADGTPTLGSSINGLGLVDRINTMGNGSNDGNVPCVMSPDGKFIYTPCSNDLAIGWACVQADGSLKYGGSTDLKAPLGLDVDAAKKAYSGFVPAQTIMSPDGKFFYMHYNYQGSGKIAFFNRDVAFGELTFKGFVPWNNWMGFSPDGKNGFYCVATGTLVGKVGYFTRDTVTGFLGDSQDVQMSLIKFDKIAVSFTPRGFLIDPVNGKTCYVTNSGYGNGYGSMNVFSVLPDAPEVAVDPKPDIPVAPKK